MQNPTSGCSLLAVLIHLLPYTEISSLTAELYLSSLQVGTLSPGELYELSDPILEE